jgi:hypothetical protein
MAKKKQGEVKKSASTKKGRPFPNTPKTFAGFYGVRPQVGRFTKPGLPTDTEQRCDILEETANKLIAEQCEGKEFTIEPLLHPCEGAGKGASKEIDLVIVIDSSGSMQLEAQALSDAAEDAIARASKTCLDAKPEVKWLGIEGTFPGTRFDTTLRDYLHGQNIADADIRHRGPADADPGGLGEDGGRAIEDISDHFNWRPGAKRVILFLGDEPLEGGGQQDELDKQAADKAITAANNANATVHTYAGTDIELYSDASTGVTTVSEYARVATSTGGIAYGHTDGIDDFDQVLIEILCASVSTNCGPVQLPEIRPCFTLQWGDGPKDQIETHDTEVLCLTASNPYSNVVLKDVMAHIVIRDAAGQRPAKLPDRTESLRIKPSLSICFGDLAPCSQGKNGKPDNGPCTHLGPSSISREVVLLSRNALQGPYFIYVVYCYKAEFSLAFGSVFPIELVKS